MRELKFRAWDKRRERMLYDGDSCGHVEFERHDVDVVNLLLNGHDENLTFMQYTGLKDKNGKEIYEGDIVELEYDTPYDSGGYRRGLHKAVIKNGVNFKYQQSGYYLIFKDFKDREVNRRLSWSDLKYFEVIGNIYENTELLGGTDE